MTDQTRLNARRIAKRLRTRWLGRAMEILPEIPSTNSALLRLESNRAQHGLICVAERQTSGRGRRGRAWVDMPGRSLLFSFLLRREDLESVGPMLSMAIAVGARRGIEGAAPGMCQVQWPNDLVIQGRKVAGILVERGAWSHPGGWVVGIGMNVNGAKEEFPEEVARRATSIAVETGQSCNRDMLLAELLNHIEESVEALVEGGDAREAIRSEWIDSCDMMNRRITVDTGVEEIEGVVVGLEEHGGLVLRLPGDETRIVRSGTVVRGK